MSLFENAVQIKKLLVGMEKDIGLDELSDPEKSIFYAAIDLSNGAAIHSNNIRTHSLAANLTKATFFRALKALVTKGLLVHEVGTKTGQYRIGRVNGLGKNYATN